MNKRVMLFLSASVIVTTGCSITGQQVSVEAIIAPPLESTLSDEATNVVFGSPIMAVEEMEMGEWVDEGEDLDVFLDKEPVVGSGGILDIASPPIEGVLLRQLLDDRTKLLFKLEVEQELAIALINAGGIIYDNDDAILVGHMEKLAALGPLLSNYKTLVDTVEDKNVVVGLNYMISKIEAEQELLEHMISIRDMVLLDNAKFDFETQILMVERDYIDEVASVNSKYDYDIAVVKSSSALLKSRSGAAIKLAQKVADLELVIKDLALKAATLGVDTL